MYQQFWRRDVARFFYVSYIFFLLASLDYGRCRDLFWTRFQIHLHCKEIYYTNINKAVNYGIVLLQRRIEKHNPKFSFVLKVFFWLYPIFLSNWWHFVVTFSCLIYEKQFHVSSRMIAPEENCSPTLNLTQTLRQFSFTVSIY